MSLWLPALCSTLNTQLNCQTRTAQNHWKH